jgi:hypothetical protein
MHISRQYRNLVKELIQVNDSRSKITHIMKYDRYTVISTKDGGKKQQSTNNKVFPGIEN